MTRILVRCSVALGCLLASAAVASGSAVAAPAPSSVPFGVVGMAANGVPGETTAERAAAYRRLYRAGVRVIRLDITWMQVEPQGRPLHDYDFSERDRELRAIRRAGLRVIGILAYGHPDYSRLGGIVAQTPVAGGAPVIGSFGAHTYPPDDPADFARYARDTAAHYEREFPGTVFAWEVWNEENEGYRFWSPREDPDAYAELLCETYPELKRVAPRTTVSFGGLFFAAVPPGIPGTAGPDFLQAAYDSNPRLGRCYDVMAYHPYAYPFTAPELEVPGRGSVLSAHDTMLAVLERNGDGEKPLWITEVGWPTSQNSIGVPESKQAQYVARLQVASFAQGLPVLGWFTYGDNPDQSGMNIEAAFGFFRADGTAKPAYDALRTFAHTFRGASFRRDLSEELGLPEGESMMGGRGFALRYRKPGFRRGRDLSTGIHSCPPRRITAVWLATESGFDGQGHGPEGGTFGPDHAEVTVPVRSGHSYVIDYLGERVRGRPRRGEITLEIGPSPLYVIDQGPCSVAIA